MTPCVEWTGGSRNPERGYGVFMVDGQAWQAHRWIYVETFGETDLDIHHVCENKRCVNPMHLEAKTKLEHRAEHLPDQCAMGHPFSGVTSGQRVCRICRSEASQRYKDRLRGPRPKQRRLSDVEAGAIRLKRTAGGMVKDLAIEYGVSTTTIKNVTAGRVHQDA